MLAGSGVGDCRGEIRMMPLLRPDGGESGLSSFRVEEEKARGVVVRSSGPLMAVRRDRKAQQQAAVVGGAAERCEACVVEGQPLHEGDEQKTSRSTVQAVRRLNAYTTYVALCTAQARSDEEGRWIDVVE